MSVNRRAVARGHRYDVRLRLPGGGHLKRTFRTRKEADNFEAAHRADMARGTWLDPRDADRTVETVARDWLLRDVAKRGGTLARDESVLRLHVLPVIGIRPLHSVRSPDVQTLVNQWSTSAAPRTVRRQSGVLRAVFNYAIACDYIAKSPCRAIKLPEISPLRRPQLSVDDVVSLANAPGDDYGAMVYLGAVLGLRWGECGGLRVGRVDFLRGTLTVAEQLTRGASGCPEFGEPKSDAGVRTQSVPPHLMALLNGVLVRRNLTGADGNALLFVAPEGGPLRYEHWRRRIWLPARQAAGLDNATFHDLRRTNATGLVAEGVDIKTAANRLGHSDPRLTLALYAQATSTADRAAADALGRRFFGEESNRRAIDAP